MPHLPYAGVISYPHAWHAPLGVPVCATFQPLAAAVADLIAALEHPPQAKEKTT